MFLITKRIYYKKDLFFVFIHFGAINDWNIEHIVIREYTYIFFRYFRNENFKINFQFLK